MKKLYFFILTLSFATVSAQTAVDFTEAEGYVQGALNNNADWGGSNWIASPANSRIECAGGYSWARWAEPFTVANSEITFEVHFKFNIDLPAGKLISRMGFTDVTDGSANGNQANIQLATLNDGSMSIRKQNNVPVDSGGAGLTDFQQDDLVLKVTLTLGTDASSSTISSNIVNSTDGLESGIAVINGISAAVFTAATTGGISGYIHAQDNINGTRNILVDKVIMTQGNTLSTNKIDTSEYFISTNFQNNTLDIHGMDIGTAISIYSVSGSKMISKEFNGSSIDVGNLNTGIYFLNAQGYKAKTFLKK